MIAAHTIIIIIVISLFAITNNCYKDYNRIQERTKKKGKLFYSAYGLYLFSHTEAVKKSALKWLVSKWCHFVNNGISELRITRVPVVALIRFKEWRLATINF